MHMTELNRAPLSAYKSLHSAILCGETLNEVKQIERSIARFGLLSPIVVTAVYDQLIVVDGKKRLAAIKRMTFAGTLPRSLQHIPYIFVHKAKKADMNSTSALAPRQVYKAVMELKEEGKALEDIADTLYLCRRIILDVINLSRLFPAIRETYFNGGLNFDQARAYASVPDHRDQIALLGSLGPQAKPETILNAIKGWRAEAKPADAKPAPALVIPLTDYLPAAVNSVEFIAAGAPEKVEQYVA
ncbi:ParB-like nuclease family protein [Litorimonas taeanensis]|uniref:ParB-like nuclease family protein n=2 Tax=Litorimonas taeanensis TaxID=568099 RepID=A0A420WF37_9PROT|nr:ParB-like nuclease family protein [Litorimonas taeanensis]